MYETLRRRTGGLHTATVAASTARTVLASAAMAVALLAGLAAFGAGSLPPLLAVLGGGLIGAVTVVAVSYAAGSEEARGLVGQGGKQLRALLRPASRRAAG
jgi:hypothetical protein